MNKTQRSRIKTTLSRLADVRSEIESIQTSLDVIRGEEVGTDTPRNFLGKRTVTDTVLATVSSTIGTVRVAHVEIGNAIKRLEMISKL